MLIFGQKMVDWRYAKREFPNLFKLETGKDCLVADRLPRDQATCFLWKWKSTIVSGLEAQELIQLTQALNSQTLLPGLDKWAWMGSCTDAFSVGMFKKVIEDAWFPIEDYIHKLCKWVPIRENS
ncbi:hypothetical protein L1987_77325 [Smallanthus sonchifolius]|uniref:Uncharacterized protein n=1 Tax=Smallanthus sonchifolius TaxID=185202 RepID=A0ACB8ZE27_9ASTR|nr:hypothetical protein L1987_77325 [Smallanthus sonchifolius]